MRSSVSYILSSSTVEPNMSYPDYEQYSHDHAALLILVKHIGSQLKLKTFSKFFDRISKLNDVKITDSSGQIRNIRIRYVKEYPVENNDWGDFQTHRRLLGLISLGKYDSQVELNEVCRVHESLKVKYNNTLYDSRCILFGPIKETTDSPTSPVDVSSASEESDTKPESSVEKFATPSNFKTRALFYDESAPCTDLESQLNEFINSLFWVLESKRLERSREKLERVSLLLAPFEKKDFVGLDMESRNNRKRCTGRMTKHLGDLCLQAGLLPESLAYYTNSAETLGSINDWLWLGAAFEGLCTASALVLYPEMQRNVPLQRNASLQEGSPRRTSHTSITSTPVRRNIANTLSSEMILKRYREVIIHYSKYQNAGVVETEACFKAARIAVEQSHALQAASFLQNVVYINLNLSEQERIQRFETLADLYTQIGFNRKAAFCLKLAATKHVSPQNPSPNWQRCYELTLLCLAGHGVALDPSEMRGPSASGWPAIQAQLLQDLVLAARRAGHSALATRHMTLLLQTMWPFLGATERKELAIQLQALSSQCEGSPVPLVLDSGLVVPPANLTDIPHCAGFTLRDLKPHLRPRPVEKEQPDSGPFLFTPLHFGGGGPGSLERKRNKANARMDFQWVENEVCEVFLKLINPLPFELKVSNMQLLTGGVVFESVPETVVLLPEVTTPVTLSGWPRESGELELAGYSTHALGVKSNCRLKDMITSNFPPQYRVEVVPSLPILQVSTSLPQSASFSNFHDDNIVTSASLSLFHGENAQCIITFTNTSQIPVEFLEVEMTSMLDSSIQEQIFQFDKDELNSQLPLLPDQSATLTVNIHYAASFLAPNSVPSPTIPHDMSSGVFSSMSASLPPMSSLPSRFNSSFRSSHSGQSSIAGGLALLFQQGPPTSSTVEGQLKVRYSGGGGLTAGHCRACSVFVIVEATPSLHVTNWDVLPAETSTQFYLVLDVANLTSQEMELQYTPTKTMLIEGQESCRVPVPVDRCPLHKFSDMYEELDESDTKSNIDINRICSEHIAEHVDLRWHLLASDSKGTASLKGIYLNTRMLDIVRMSPLEWEIKINGGVFKVQDDVTCEAGDCLEFQMSVLNILKSSLKQLTLSVQFYQDYENGTLNYRMDNRLAMAGSTKKILPELEPNSSVNHQCNVIFFHPGQYKMDIQCCAPDSGANMGAVLPTAHVWRFTPPITVQVN